jgi:poly-gamma-glutamate synthesis protein (capsule biosynthesis protein)
MRRLFPALAVLLASCGGPPAREPAPAKPPPAIRLVAGGDVMLARHVGAMARLKLDPALPFRNIAPVTAAADIAFVNLESPFSERGPYARKGMVFRAAPDMIEGLKLAGIDVVSMANNHARDAGEAGLLFTLKHLRENGIAVAGLGASAAEVRAGAVLERRGVRFGFLAYTYDQRNGNHASDDDRVATLDERRMREDVAALKRRADTVVVSMHAGAEYRTAPSVEQVSFAHAAVDAGASLVIGHHPHVAQPAGEYRGALILYSLGNLVFDQFHRRDTQKGLLAEVVFEGPRLASYTLHGVRIYPSGPRIEPFDPSR